jgi:hypothetical protein
VACSALHQVDAFLQIPLHFQQLRVRAVRGGADLRSHIFQLLLVPAVPSNVSIKQENQKERSARLKLQL